MAINRYRETNFPVNIIWTEAGNHVVRIENQISSICVGTTQNLTDAKIGQAVKVIEDQCFYRCTGLSSLTFVEDFTNADGDPAQGTRLSRIEMSAFADCTSLHNVKFNDDSVSESIGDSAFRRSGVRDVTVRTKNLGNYAFENADELSSVQLTADECIGNYAFANTDGLVDAEVLVNGSIGKYAFARSKIETADIAYISSSARLFHNCNNLTDVTVNAKALKFGDFAGCTKLSSLRLDGLETIDLTLPNGNNLGDLIDDPSGSITSWYNADGVVNESYYSRNDHNLKTILKLGVFDTCTSLAKIEFPSTFRGIDKSSLTKKTYTGGNSSRDKFYIDTADIPLFYHSEVQEIKFNFVPDSSQGDEHESTDGLSVYLYPKIFSEIHVNGSDKKTVISFNDTYDQVWQIAIDQNGNHILDDIIQTSLNTNPIGSIIFQFKDASFNPSALDTVLSFSSTSIEKISHAVPVERTPGNPATATACIKQES